MLNAQQNSDKNHHVTLMELKDKKVIPGDFSQYDNLLKTVFSKEEVEAFYARFLAINPLEEVLNRIA